VGPSDGLEVLKKMGPLSWSGGFGESRGLKVGQVVLVKNVASERVWRF